MENSVIDATGAIAAEPRFTVSRAALLPVLDLMARYVTERRNTIPVLSNVRIEASPIGELRLMATDLDLQMTATIAADVETPGATTVSLVTLRDIVKKAAKEAQISLWARDGRCAVNHGRAAQSIPTLPVDDFPVIQPMTSATLSAEFDAAQLAADLALVSPAISTEETRYYLNGIAVSIEGDKFCMAATDGHRLSLVERDAAPIVAMNFGGGIIPRKAIKAIAAMLKGKESGPVALDMSGSKALLDCGDIQLYTKLIDGTFPDYRRVIPAVEHLSGALSVQSAELLQHCATVDGKGSTSKALQFQCEGGAIMAGQAGSNPYARPLSAGYDGQDCAFAFNAGYMSQFAKMHGALIIQSATLDGDKNGLLGAPMLIKSPDAPHWTGVLMPMRCDGELPKPRVVTYPDVQPAPGRAADLYGIEAPRYIGNNHGTIGLNPGARKATGDEVEAYARDYAARCGLDVNGLDDDYRRNSHGQVIAATFGEYVTVILPGYFQPPVTVEMLGDDGEYSAPMTCTDAKGRIALPDQPKGRAKAKPRASTRRVFDGKGIDPAYIAAPVVDATLSDELASEALPTPPIGHQCEDGRGFFIIENATDKAIAHYPDYDSANAAHSAIEPKPSYPNEVWPHIWRYMICAAYGLNDCRADLIEMTARYFADVQALQIATETPQDDAPATQLPQEPEIASSEAEIAPIVDVEAQPDPVAALIARMDALEAMIINATTIEAAKVNVPPSVEISDDAPLSVQPKRTVAHIRAIMAYLAMREKRRKVTRRMLGHEDQISVVTHQLNEARSELDSERKHNAIGMQQLDAMRADRDEWEELQHRTWGQAMGFKLKRRRAVLKARDLQTRLYAEHKLVDRYAEKRREAEQSAHELSVKEQVEQERANVAERQLSDLRGRLADPANPARESDMLLLKRNAETWEARAIAAIGEGERLKRLALQNAGHIETLASRIARAETLLRESGAMPVLTIVPPCGMSLAA